MHRKAVPLIALAAASAATPGPTPPGTYAVETGVAGVVDLYDLSSVARTADGFSIIEVVASTHWPHVFGPTAYRVDRETYHCGTDRYEISALEEHRRDGRLIVTLPGTPRGTLRLVPRTASSEVYNRFCPPGVAGRLAGLAPVRIVHAAGRFAAYRIGWSMLTRRSR